MRAREKRGRRRGREGEREEGVAGCGKQGLGAVWLVTRAEREREREKQEMEREAGYSCTVPFCVGLKKTFHWRDLRDPCS